MPKGKRNPRTTVKTKVDEGFKRTISKKPSLQNDWNLGWFRPSGCQGLIVDSMDDNDLTVVKAPSGCGKSATVLWKALCDYKEGKYQHIYLIKTPVECGSDMLGFLKGDMTDKLSVHMESMKSIFHQFMSKGKLENDISNGNIVLTIPNFLQGMTLDDSLIIIEESQNLTPSSIKLCAERAGSNSKVVIVGDPKQAYGIKKREDGLQDLIDKVTHDNYGIRFTNYSNVGYIEMKSDNNRRSNLSKFITDLY